MRGAVVVVSRVRVLVVGLLVAIGVVASGLVVVPTAAHSSPSLVIAPYYAGWEQSALPPSALPWDAMTHVIHFSLLPTASGGLNDTTNGVTATRASALIAEARKHNVKVLISVGGTPGSEHWASAASAANRTTFVNNLVNLMASRGYDGIDLNWEGSVNEADYLAVMRELRARLDARGKGELLTGVYYGSWSRLAASSHPLLDWVSMMSYLPYGQPGNSHNSPISGSQFARIDNLVNNWLTAGVPAHKIVFGLATYASEWADGKLVTPEMPYRTAAAKGYTTNLAWDATARASAWRSATTFVSIEDDRAVKEKAAYLTTKNLRGLIVWELGAGRHNGTIPVMDSLRRHLPPTTTTTTEPVASPAPASTITASSVFASTSGTTASGGYTVTTDRPVTFQRVVLAVRDAEGRIFDFAGADGVTVDGALSVSGSRSSLPSGTYTARVAYQLDGTWTQTGPTVTFTVVSPTLSLTSDKQVFRRVWRSTATVRGNVADGTSITLTFRSAMGTTGSRSCVMSAGMCTTAFVQLPTGDSWLRYDGPAGVSITVTP